MKRIFDIILSLLLLAPSLVILVIAVIFVSMETKGPVIFKQNRVGRDGKLFQIYKLRTMYNGTGDRASHEVSIGSITKVGYYLRKTKIDELPQIWSVLIGDMSFVGPRPCLPQQVELVELRRKQGALDVRPGITGPAQIAGIDMSTPIKLAEIDASYARNHSFFNDLKVILATAIGGGAGDAASTVGREF